MNLNSLGDMIIEEKDPEEIFEILDLLGEGAYGSVSKALHKPSGELVAIKIVPNNNDQISNIKKEIIILRECKSEYVVKYYGSYYKDNNLWIVMEYCVAGSVIDVIRITERQLNEYEIASILQAVLRGLEYLHSRKVIHRDVKAGNILLDHKGNAKLADFGVSAEIVNTHAQRKTFIGSPYWMSPEILSESNYDNKTDIWSLGITAIEIAEGNAPYSNIHPLRAMWVIRNNPVKGLKQPSKWSEQFHSFITCCLHSKPNERLAASQLLNHPFILKKAKGKAILSQLVLNSMDTIEKYRIKQSKKRFSSEDQDNNSLQMKFVEDKKETIRMEGTVKRLDELGQQDEEDEEEPYESGTLVIKDSDSSNVGSASSPSDQKDKDEPEFMKFAKKMRQADDLYNNRDKFKQYIENKSELPSPIEFSTPRVVVVEAKPPNQDQLRSKISQLDRQCEQQLKKVLAKYKLKIDQQVTTLSKTHNKQFNKSQLKTYNVNLEQMAVSSHLKRQPAQIRNINNINSINISINEKKTTKEVKPTSGKGGCSSCEKQLRIQEDKQAFKKSKKYKQFVDDSQVLEYLKKNYMCKK